MIVNKLIEKSMKKAQGAQASMGRSESTNVSFENDRLKSVKSSQNTGISLKVIVNGKIGSSFTTDIEDTDGIVKRALESAEFGGPAHFEFPGFKQGTEVKVYDTGVESLKTKEMVNLGEEMISLVKKYNEDITINAGANKNVNNFQFSNSAGTEYSYDATSYSIWVDGQWIRGTDILWAGHSAEWKKLEIDHTGIAKTAVDLFKMAEVIAPVKSGEMPVIFTPEGLNVLLLGLSLGFDGKNAFLGSSPISNKIGKKIADEKFSITDNALIDYAASSSIYDGEGVPHQVTPIIESGVLKNFLYDLDTAGRAGKKTTGNGAGCAATNLIVKEGSIPFNEMVKNVKEGLLVHSVLGLGQGNPVSGEFSVNILLGYKIENGEITGRVKDVMLAGNTYDALNDIIAIGDKGEWVGGSLYTPHIQVGSLSVIAR